MDRVSLQEKNVVANQNERIKATRGVKFYEQDRHLLEKVEKQKQKNPVEPKATPSDMEDSGRSAR